MNDEIKKMKQKELIMSVLLIIFILLALFVIIFVVSNKDSNNDLIYESNYLNDVDNYIIKEEIDTANYFDVYNSVHLSKIKFKNISSLLYGSFVEKEEEFLNHINDNLKLNKKFLEDYIKENNILNYKLGSSIDSIVLTYINDGVLSVLYLIEEEIDYKGINNYITSIVIDIKNNKVLSSYEILNSYSLSLDDVVQEIYDNYLLNKENLVDYNYFKEVLINNLDSYVYFYIYMDNLYLKYNKSDLDELFNNSVKEKVRYSTIKLSS